MVLANRGGALLHRLVAEEGAAGAVATPYAKPRGGGATWEVGYRVADVGRSEDADDDAAARDFVLRQEVAVLGGPAWARELS